MAKMNLNDIQHGPKSLLEGLQQPVPSLDILAGSSIFKPNWHFSNIEQSTKTSYLRAKAVAKAYGISSRTCTRLT